MAKPNGTGRFLELLERLASTGDEKYARRIARWCVFDEDTQSLPVTERHRRLREIVKTLAPPNPLRSFVGEKQLVTVQVNGMEMRFATGKPNTASRRERPEHPVLRGEQQAALCEAVAAGFWNQRDLIILKSPRLFKSQTRTLEEMLIWNELIAAMQRRVSETREDAMALWKELFREYVPFIERLEQLPHAEQDRFVESEHPLLLGMVHVIAIAKPGTPLKALLTHLIDAVQARERDADRMLSGVVQLIKGHAEPLEIMCESAFDEMLTRKGISWDAYELTPPKQRPPEIVLNQPHEQLLRNFLMTQLERLTAQVKRMHEVLRWTRVHADEMSQQFDRKRREIESSCRFALLPDGQDHFEIHLTPLTCLGIRSIAFYPGGLKPPDTDIRISVEKEGPFLVTYTATLRDLAFDVPDHLFANNIGLPESLFATLLWMVVIDVLHFITVRNEENESPKRKSSGNATFPAGTTRIKPMRARLRNLPTGWHASPEAIERAHEKCGWVVPDGQTFVKEHERNVHGVRCSLEPVCTFTDDLFMKSFSIS